MQITTIVLAGGRGTRIAHLSGDRPKPLVEVNGRPFLDWLTLYLMRAGLMDLVYSAGYKAEQIEGWLRGFEAGKQSLGALRLRVVREDAPLGTGGAVLACLDACDEWLLALNGDSLALFDLGRLLALANEPGMDGALVGLPIDDASRYGSLDIAKKWAAEGLPRKETWVRDDQCGLLLASQEPSARPPPGRADQHGDRITASIASRWSEAESDRRRSRSVH